MAPPQYQYFLIHPEFYEKSQHGCVRWALREHITPPCSDFACGRLEDHHQTKDKYHYNYNMYFSSDILSKTLDASLASR